MTHQDAPNACPLCGRPSPCLCAAEEGAEPARSADILPFRRPATPRLAPSGDDGPSAA